MGLNFKLPTRKKEAELRPQVRVGYFQIDKIKQDILPVPKIPVSLPMKTPNRALSLSAGAFIFLMFLMADNWSLTGAINKFGEGIFFANRAVGVTYNVITAPLSASTDLLYLRLATMKTKTFTAAVQVADVSPSIWDQTSNSIQSFGQTIASKWREFLTGKKEPSVVITPAMREEIKKIVAEEVNTNLSGILSQNNSLLPNLGAVVAPTTGDTSSDETLKKNLAQQFSDRVTVKFDQSGRAGVITPVFSDNKQGSDYIFLLTPVK